MIININLGTEMKVKVDKEIALKINMKKGFISGIPEFFFTDAIKKCIIRVNKVFFSY